ncbi:MAG: hypothetical protein ACREUM_07880 [Nitrosospira sp.]
MLHPTDAESMAQNRIREADDFYQDNGRAQVIAMFALAEAVLTQASAIHHRANDKPQ